MKDVEKKMERITGQRRTDAEKVSAIFANSVISKQQKTIKGIIIALVISIIINAAVIGGVMYVVSSYDLTTTESTIDGNGDLVNGNQYKDSATHNQEAK